MSDTRPEYVGTFASSELTPQIQQLLLGLERLLQMEGLLDPIDPRKRVDHITRAINRETKVTSKVSAQMQQRIDLLRLLRHAYEAHGIDTTLAIWSPEIEKEAVR